MVVIEEDVEDGEREEVEEIDSEEEERRKDEEKERSRDYLQFRRNFDAMKADVEGIRSEAENLKVQGNQMFTFGCYTQATYMYSQALELQPKNHVLYCNRAMAYLKQDMADEALADAEESLRLDATVTNIKAHWRKAQALLDLQKPEESEAASNVGLELQPKNQHLNGVRRKAREAIVTRRLVGCEWVGKLASGIEQRLTFTSDGGMTMTVFGHSIPSTFELSVEGRPQSMVVTMNPDGAANGAGGAPPPRPAGYIFEFQGDEELWLCSPTDPRGGLPEKFEGPGLVKLRRTVLANADAGPVEAIDVRCTRYMKEMNKVLPVVPPQLPEKPSDDQIQQEVLLTETLCALKRREGPEVHRRCIGFAKDPSSASNELLASLARRLQKRLLARKLIDPSQIVPESVPEPPAVGEQAAAGEQNSATAQEAATKALVPAKPAAKAPACFGLLGCFGM